jgi:hypothetical protein
MSLGLAIGLRFGENISSLIDRILLRCGLKDGGRCYHLYGLGANFKSIPDDALASVFFLSSYREFYLLTCEVQLVTIYYEDCIAEIEFDKSSLVGDLLYWAIRCFNLPLDPNPYIAVDPVSLAVARIDSRISYSSLVLKSTNFYAPGLVFSADSFSPTPGVDLTMLSKFLISPQLKMLLSSIRRHQSSAFQVTELSDSRMSELIDIYQTSADISKDLSETEQRTLLLLLFSSNDKPFLSERLHRLALTAISSLEDGTKFELTLAFIAVIPVETYIFLSEISLTYGSIPPLLQNAAIAATLVGELIFSPSIDRDAEIRFTTFLLICSQWLFKFPSKPDRHIRISGSQIVVFDRTLAMTLEGPTDIEMDATSPFVPSRSLEEVLKSLPRPSRSSIEGYTPAPNEIAVNPPKECDTTKEIDFTQLFG